MFDVGKVLKKRDEIAAGKAGIRRSLKYMRVFCIAASLFAITGDIVSTNLVAVKVSAVIGWLAAVLWILQAMLDSKYSDRVSDELQACYTVASEMNDEIFRKETEHENA